MTNGVIPLAQLHPRWMRRNKTAFRFDCPVCSSPHHIAVATSAPSLSPTGYIWTHVGGDDFTNLTVNPSINCDVPELKTRCKFHGFIRNGMVSWTVDLA
jgi:hypothetical protein